MLNGTFWSCRPFLSLNIEDEVLNQGIKQQEITDRCFSPYLPFPKMFFGQYMQWACSAHSAMVRLNPTSLVPEEEK